VKGRNTWLPRVAIILISAVLLGLLGFGLLRVLQRIRIQQKKPADLPLKEIDSNKLGQFSRQYELTRREQEILEILVHGKSNKEISEDLYISTETTKKHIKNIMRKTQARSRLEILVKISNF
jgi:DNA-binding NarL/FixJ family response regulator